MFKSIAFEKYLAVFCLLLCSISIYSITVSNYLFIYLVFFVSFAALLVGYFLLNKTQLYKLLFLFAPLTLSIDIVGDAQIQMPTEVMIGMITLLFFVSIRDLKHELKEIFKHPIAWMLGLEVLWLIICSLTSQLMMVSFKFTFIRICYVSTFFIMGIFWLKKVNKPWLLYLLYTVGLILPIINGLLYHSKFDFKQSAAYIMPQPFYNDHTVYGACIAFIIPPLVVAIFQGKKIILNPLYRFFLMLLLVFLLVAVFFSYSRAAWLSLVCVLIFAIILALKMNAKTIIGIILGAGLITMIFSDSLFSKLEENKAISNKEDLAQQVKSIGNVATDVSNKERINRWICAIRMGKAKPVFGFGPRTYKFFYGGFQSHETMTRTSTFAGNKGHSHSDYLAYWAETGLPGFILHILVYLTVLYKGINLVYQCKNKLNRVYAYAALLAVITYFIHGIFNGFMEDDKMASLVFFSMAVLVFVELEENKIKKENQPLLTT